MRRLVWIVCVVALVGGSAPGAGAEVRRIESVGAIPLQSDVRRSSPPRDAAVRRALNSAVWQVALGLLPGMGETEAQEVLPGALGDDPFEFTTRFRIIEDRGEVPASLTDDPQASLEYVVVVEANIDASRVEKRLKEAGLMFTRSGSAAHPVTVVVERLTDFIAYQKLLEALVTGAGANSAVPAEFERGRAVIAVEALSDAPQLLEDLLAGAPPGLQITSLGVVGDVLTLRIEYEAVVEDPGVSTGAAPRVRRN
jgi:hypothetical protein